MTLPAGLRSIVRAVLAAGALLVAAGVSPALAASPMLTDQVTDDAGVLAGQTAQVRDSLDELFRSEALRLWVVFVPTTNGELAEDVARHRFTDNHFGPNDMLLIVAVEDHRYGWWESTATGTDRGTATGMPSYEVDAMLSAALDPSFRAGDYAGGIVSLAKALTVSVRVARNSTPAPSVLDFGGYGPVDDSSQADDELWLIPLITVGGTLGIIALAAFGAAGESGRGGWSSGGGSGSSGGWSGGGGSGSSWGSSSSSGHGGGGGWSGGSSSGGSSGGHGGGGGW